MKSRRDIKFIIYQSLYIFVICVIAIKGANLDLIEVEMKKMTNPGWTYVDTTNKVLIDKNEFTTLIKFDPKAQIIVSLDEWNRQYPNEQPPIASGTGTILPISDNPPPDDKTETTNHPIPTDPGSDKIIDPVFPSNFIQYRQNTITNANAVDMIVQTPTGNIIIPPRSSKNVLLSGENTITLKAENISKTYNVKENKKPQIMFQRMIIMNEDAKVTQLQRNVCYRVTISDDFVDQLDVKFSGGVTINNKGNGIYDITMNAFGSRLSFENWAEGKPEPYSVGFNVTVSDKFAPHKIIGQQSFVFGEW